MTFPTSKVVQSFQFQTDRIVKEVSTSPLSDHATDSALVNVYQTVARSKITMAPLPVVYASFFKAGKKHAGVSNPWLTPNSKVRHSFHHTSL